MAETWPNKDPQDVLDYIVEWADWLDTDTISSSAFTIADDADLTVDSSSINGTKTVVWLSGGTLGVTALVTNHIVTTAGREIDQTVRLRIRSR